MNAPFSLEAFETFRQSLLLMLQGMAGIFIFMLVFYGLINLLQLVFKQEKTEEL